MPVIVPSQILHYDIVDSTIYFVSEDLKSRVMDNVKQLGTWVEFEFGAKAYARMTYNANTDTAVLEYLEFVDIALLAGTQSGAPYDPTTSLSQYNSSASLSDQR